MPERRFGRLFRVSCLATLLLQCALLLGIPDAVLASGSLPACPCEGAGSWDAPAPGAEVVASVEASGTQLSVAVRAASCVAGGARAGASAHHDARARCALLTCERSLLNARTILEAAKSGRDTARTTTIPPPTL